MPAALIALFVFVMVAGLAVAVDAFFVEPYRIEVTHSSVQAPLAQPLKIAHLSDLHTSGLGRRERQLLLLLDAEQPDVIVITGDTVTWGHPYDKDTPATLTFARTARRLARAWELGERASTLR